MIDPRPVPTRIRSSLALAASLVLLLAAPVRAEEAQDADWPCAQRLVPELSAATVWAGPPLDDALATWQDDEEVVRLVGEASARSVPLDQARQKIAAFADGLTADRDARLTRLFAGLLQTINSERSSIIAGIGRYTRKQRALAARIEQTGSELDKPADQSDQKTRSQLQQRQEWDIRIYQDREHSTKYLCQQPVDLEQRLFQLARVIQEKLQ
ncbi:hypothetical protein SAMN06265365_121114 [Tistlia consotensis]|uniref:Secreted protein n=1 Tax=Tistlia consotensis USBA 355 TaxID=560819 RepID=A0A1Y6CMF7_9PROT|nr:hypothetical protein [Tistlia consotensis]SMF60053.1 hypothetical protein SAMN05428998_1239 [Tistlia consotensis USBA 355]SNR93999.1 hypothetical protein SAMN06265365_121114 [Tistlia consotensis]